MPTAHTADFSNGFERSVHPDQKSGAHGVSYAILVRCARLPKIVGKPAELSVFRQKGGRGDNF
jgi:hypothetical protein